MKTTLFSRISKLLPGLLRVSLLLILVFVSAGTVTRAASNGTQVGGEIKFDTTWTASNSPYIVTGNIQVLSGVTLTIQPGVIVKFDSGKKILVLGSMIAQGTTTQPITFTSNLPSPHPGVWGNIVFRSPTAASGSTARPLDPALAGNVMQHCIVEYGGGVDKGAIFVNTASAFIDHCTVRYSSSGGIRAVGTPNLTIVVSNNHVHANKVIGDGGGINATEANVVGNTVTGNIATANGGGIFAISSAVSGNLVSENRSQLGGGIYAFNTDGIGNVVTDNMAFRGGGIYSDISNLSGNTVLGNRSDERGAGVYLFGASTFLYNTVVDNASKTLGGTYGGVEIRDTPGLHHNNIYGNSPFDVVVISRNNVNAENNYWGTFDTGQILDHIFDFFDDNNRGLLLFSPQMPDPTSGAPVPPPLNLQADFNDNTASFSWDPVPGLTKTYTYRVYYDNDSAWPPFTGSGLMEGDSPIDVGGASSFTVTGANVRSHFFTVTAMEQSGRESWFSNVVEDLEKVYNPLILK